jgi:hypothetical protein
VNLLMCAPLYDDKGSVRYFIGAQIDVTGLVIDGSGIESFRALLRKDGPTDLEVTRNTDHQTFSNKTQWHDEKCREKHTQLRELSMMFSQDESDVVGKNIRGGDNVSDGSESIQSGIPTTVRNRGKSKRVIEEIRDSSNGLSTLMTPHNHQINRHLPGVYKHVRTSCLLSASIEGLY